jgi:hypothetical protein
MLLMIAATESGIPPPGEQPRNRVYASHHDAVPEAGAPMVAGVGSATIAVRSFAYFSETGASRSGAPASGTATL